MYRRSTLDQLQREHSMLQDGHDRFMQRQAALKDLNIDKAHSQVLQATITKVTENIRARLEEAREPKQHRPYKWVSDLGMLNPELLAYIGLVCCMEGVGQRSTRTKVAHSIGMRVEMEQFAINLYAQDKDLAKRITKEVEEKISSSWKRRTVLKAEAAKHGFEHKKWDTKRQIQAATPILSAILEASEVFEIYDIRGKKGKTFYYIGLLEAASEEIANINQRISWSEPLFTPMLTRPRDWTAQNSGCYLDPSLAMLTPLVRNPSRKQRGMINAALRSGRMQPALDAINAIQRTGYQINPYTNAAMRWAYDNNLQPGDTFPLREKLEYHKYPDNFEELPLDEKAAHALTAHEIRTLNREIDSGRSLMANDLAQLDTLVDEDEFFIPHSFDFRGRVYPVCMLNTHRSSHIKSLFLFSKRLALGERGAYWLAVQVATTGDFNKLSKASFADRVEWVMDNAERLAHIGNDFEATYADGHDICWSDADKPFEFLAACREFYGFWMHGIEHQSGLAVNLDGSASGIQHFAAATRTSRDAALVNLLPADKPQDIYQVVADLTAARMKEDTSVEAEEWKRFGVGRKTVKRNVMTYCYSSSLYGFTDQLMDDFMNPLKRAVTKKQLNKHPFSNPLLAARLLARNNMESIREVVDGAREGMAFFQQLARCMGARNETVSYFTPIGFPVDNSYFKKLKTELKIYLYDKKAESEAKRTKMVLRKDNYKAVDTRSCASAVAPNIIHSLDASHLCETVLACLTDRNQVTDFILIHDSFGTHAANTDTLFKLVRQTFVNQYAERCIYTDIKQQLINHYKLTDAEIAELPDVPTKGDLKLEDVISSNYCFA